MPQPGGLGAVLAVRACPADVGRRVTVRHRIPGEATRLTDVVGVLESWRDGTLSVRRRTGAAVEVPEADVVAARVVAPEVSAYDLQKVAQDGWRPAETEQLGDWELRWRDGVTGRANSVRVGGDPGLPLLDALDVVTRWYTARGGTPLLQLPAPSRWDRELEAAGWRTVRRTVLQTAPVGALPAPVERPDLVVSTTPDLDDELLALLDEPVETWPAYAEILTGSPVTGFVRARDAATGELLGTARVTATSGAGHRWAQVTAVATAPAARRRGVATACMAEVGRWAAEQRADQAFLQVLAANGAALALYAGLGFTPHHPYEYRAPA